MAALGHHILVDLRDCNPAKLNDLQFVQKSLLEAADAVGVTVIDHIFHQFSPQGVTGVVAIAESHLCIHTWPEYSYAAMDIFTCGKGFDPNQAVRLIIHELESKDPEVTELSRGPQSAPVPLS